MCHGSRNLLILSCTLLGLCLAAWATVAESGVNDYDIYAPLIRSPPHLWWSKIYGLKGQIRHVLAADEGGYVLAGCTMSYGPCREAWISKIDAFGVVEWSKSYGGSGIDQAQYVVTTGDGAYAVAASSQDYGEGATDVWILRLNPDGGIAWQRTYGGTNDDWARKIVLAENGALVVSAETDSYGAGARDVWLLRLNSDGTLEWQITIGGSGHESGLVEPTSDGGYLVVGGSDSFGAGDEDLWLVKLDASGTIVWQYTFGGTGSDFGLQALETGDGAFVVLGATDSFGAGSYDTWVVKVREDGSLAWQKTYGGDGDDFGVAFGRAAGGGFLVSGYSTSFNSLSHDGWFMKLDPNGDVTWQNLYGGGTFYDVFLSPVVETSDGGYLLAGETSSFGFDRTPWIMKVDGSGNIANCATIGQGQAASADTEDSSLSSSAVTQNSSAPSNISAALPLDVATQETLVCPAVPAAETCFYSYAFMDNLSNVCGASCSSRSS